MKKRSQFIVLLLLIILGGFLWKFYENQSLFEEIPVTFSSARLPLIDLTIGEKKYQVEFDLGGSSALRLKSKDLLELEKREDGEHKWGGIDGIRHNSKAYIVPKIGLGNLILRDLRVIELTAENENTGLISGQPGKNNISGSFGRTSLLKNNLFLDFPNARFIICNQKKVLGDQSKWVKVPFVLDKEGILFRVETDFGTKTFLLDSGATVNFIREDFVEGLFWKKNSSSSFGVGAIEKFIIGEKDFGKTNLFSIEIKNVEKVEGVLGMDFLRNHQVYIDFSDKMLYIH